MRQMLIDLLRHRVEKQYANTRLGSGTVGGCFGSILCHELHMGDDLQPAGLHFTAIAKKWGITVSELGDLIADHCRKLKPENLDATNV